MSSYAAPTFQVLVVDNSQLIHQRADEDAAALGPHVQVSHARDADEATALIKSKFFNVAFVDMVLDDTSKGMTVIRLLRTVARSCPIFVMSRRLGQSKYALELLTSIDADFAPLGVIDKNADEVDFALGLEQLVSEWQRKAIATRGMAPAVQALCDKADYINADLAEGSDDGMLVLRSNEQQVSLEVQYLLSEIFGNMGSSRIASALDIDLFRSGYSSSVALDVLPSMSVVGLSDPLPGNRCVVKIGPVNEIRTEVRRYEQVVRFGLPLPYRVELLDSAYGDALAAICYSFAGGGRSEIRSFDDLLAANESEEWLRVLNKIFEVTPGNWYMTTGEAPSLKRYFDRERKTPLSVAIDRFEVWVKSLAKNLRGVRIEEHKNTSTLYIGETLAVAVPKKDMLGSGALDHAMHGCFAHGDLHGGNLLVDTGGAPYLIDFQNAGLSPRVVDFAALQATVRTAHAEQLQHSRGETDSVDISIEGLQQIVKIEGAERTGARTLRRRAAVNAQAPWWLKVAGELDQAMWKNCKTATWDEAMWTYWAYCVSMFRIVHLEWQKKARLLAWLSAMTVELDE